MKGSHEMKAQDIATKIALLPREYYALRNVSFDSLIKQSNYSRSSPEITEEAIREALADQPDLVDDWLKWSEDKRTSTGWYFTKQTDGAYIVGHILKGKDEPERSRYLHDPIAACACFVKLEVDDVVGHSSN